MVVGAHDPFGVGGWVSLLLGQRVPYRYRHRPAASELAAVEALRAQHRAAAQSAMTAEEVSAAIASPRWQWR
jgi:tryptophan halogenase